MREAVSEILEERMEVAGGMSRMVLVSLIAHSLLIGTLLWTPEFWRAAPKAESNPMYISLGGAEGPDAGGMNPLSARNVQEVAPRDVRARPTPPPTPAPEMVEPAPTAKPTTKPTTKPVEKPAEKTTARKPTTGAQTSKGSAVAETGSKVQVPFGGLSTGGGGTGGARVDIPNFCCPGYLTTIVDLIKRNWNRNQGITGQNTLKFVVQRDGRITDIEVEQSGGQLLDIASERALRVTRLPPLPREFTGDTLTIHLIFEYNR